MDTVTSARLGRERSVAFLGACRRLAAALWEQAGLRFELLTLELAEERARIVGVLVAIAAIVVGIALALAFAGLAALIAAWDTPYRITVAIVFAVSYAAIALIAMIVVRSLLGRGSPLFRHSLAEWRRDVDSLAPKIEPGQAP
jgi:uncharacterized membrane protein YqjE